MLLSESQFKSTFGKKMNDVTETAEDVFDIWPYVSDLIESYPELGYTAENGLVEKVYRNSDETYDHVVLPTSRQNVSCVIVVDLYMAKVYGYYFLDFNVLYGLTT